MKTDSVSHSIGAPKRVSLWQRLRPSPCILDPASQAHTAQPYILDTDYQCDIEIHVNDLSAYWVRYYDYEENEFSMDGDVWFLSWQDAGDDIGGFGRTRPAPSNGPSKALTAKFQGDWPSQTLHHNYTSFCQNVIGYPEVMA
jgi:hypothetical protein